MTRQRWCPICRSSCCSRCPPGDSRTARRRTRRKNISKRRSARFCCWSTRPSPASPNDDSHSIGFMSFRAAAWRSACVWRPEKSAAASPHTGAHHMGTSQKTVSATDVKSITHELTRENKPESPIIQALQRQVANAFVLYANYKHYHWQTYGPLFRDLHKLFDQLAEDVLPTLDEFAERVRMIGQDPPAHLIAAADLATVAPAAPHSTMREMVEEANRNLLVVIKEMRHAAKIADEHED